MTPSKRRKSKARPTAYGRTIRGLFGDLAFMFSEEERGSQPPSIRQMDAALLQSIEWTLRGLDVAERGLSDARRDSLYRVALEMFDVGMKYARSQHVAPHLRQKVDRIRRMNEKRVVPQAERELVEKMNRDLANEYPEKTPRYRKIAERTNLSADRVRYIIEGPRRKK